MCPWCAAPCPVFLFCFDMRRLQESVQAEEDVAGVVPEPDALQASPPESKPSIAFNQNIAISAYMAIAASAFGLISDGCTCPTYLLYSVRPNKFI